MNEPQITIIGNLTSDPELRFTPNGNAVADISIASTPRQFNKQTSQYEDGTTLWMRGTVWGRYAENVAESLKKGMQVIATGDLIQHEWTGKDGQSRSRMQLNIREIGPTLRFAQAKVVKGGQASRPQPKQPTFNASQGGGEGDPWATGGAGAWDQGEPPF